MQQCQQFKTNPSINPLTGKPIKIGKLTYLKLSEACNSLPREPSIKANANREQQVRVYPAPPVGPLMHWKMTARTNLDSLNNIIRHINYVDERVTELTASHHDVSKMELAEFSDFISLARREFQAASLNKQYTLALNDLSKRVNSIKDTKVIYDDVPEYKVIAGTEVKPRRFYNRITIFEIWSLYNTALELVEHAIETRQFAVGIDPNVITELKSKKKFFNYLISNNIFTHDDIYKNTFGDERAFDHIDNKHRQYLLVKEGKFGKV